MIYNEQKGNLFDLDNKYALAHCISYDTDNSKSWNLGIVVEFKKKFSGIKEYTNNFIRENNLSCPCVVPYNKNERVVFGENGIYITECDLMDYDWNVEKENNKISDLKKGLKTNYWISWIK